MLNCTINDHSLLLQFSTMPTKALLTEQAFEDAKGKPIFITGGQYKDHDGWLRKDTKQPEKMYHVIVWVKRTDDFPLGLTTSLTKQQYVHFIDTKERKCYEDAAFQQFPEIDAKMSEVAAEMASMRLVPNQRLVDYFCRKITDAAKVQKSFGRKARYRNVDCEFPLPGLNDDDETESEVQTKMSDITNCEAAEAAAFPPGYIS